MGQIYFRQEKYDVALCHFRSAAAINPRSSVLHCYIGMALAKQGIHDKALTKLQVSTHADGCARCSIQCSKAFSNAGDGVSYAL